MSVKQQLVELAHEVKKNTQVSRSALMLINGLGIQLQQVKNQLDEQGADTAALEELTTELAANSADLANAVLEHTAAAQQEPPLVPAPEETPAPTPEETPAAEPTE